MPTDKKAPATPDTPPRPETPDETASVPAWKPGDPVPERPKTLAGRQSYIAAELGRVPKRGYNKFHNYQYALEGDVMAVLNPLMAKWGVYMRHFPQTSAIEERVMSTREGKAPDILYRVPYHIQWVSTDRNEDGSEDEYTSEWMALAIDNSDKGLNKAYTAAVKYAVMKTYGIATGDDPDAGGAHDATPQLPPAQAAAQHQGMVDKLQGQRQAPPPQPRQAAAPTGPEPEWMEAAVTSAVEDGKTSTGTTITRVTFDLGEDFGSRTAALFGSGTRLKTCQDAQRHGTFVEVKLRAKEFRGKTEYQVDDVREHKVTGPAAAPPPAAPAPDAHLFGPEGGDDDIPF